VIVIVVEPWAYFTLLALMIANICVGVQKIFLLRREEKRGRKP
jgi:hypothetical protein